MSDSPSGTSTPRSFANQSATAEDLLKSQTVGLVNLSEFRKRRADVLELKEKEARDAIDAQARRSATGTPVRDLGGRAGTVATLSSDVTDAQQQKKRKKVGGKALLSFGAEDGEDGVVSSASAGAGGGPVFARKSAALKSRRPKDDSPEVSLSDRDADSKPAPRKFAANPNSVLPAPKAMTKAALAKEMATREKLQKDFLKMQEKVKNTEIQIPFVFHDGSNVPGGMVKVKKGDHIWLFLERCRKVGAEIGTVGTNAATGLSSKNREESKRQWARVGVDDLLCVRGNVIVPHHYEFYYFIANKIPDPSGQRQLLFDYSGVADDDKNNMQEELQLLRTPGTEKLEGRDDDPTFTKVVDRWWYEKNKHIYPASLWREFKADADFAEVARGQKDTQGNSFFY